LNYLSSAYSSAVISSSSKLGNDLSYSATLFLDYSLFSLNLDNL